MDEKSAREVIEEALSESEAPSVFAHLVITWLNEAGFVIMSKTELAELREQYADDL